MFGLNAAMFTNPWALVLEGLAILALVFGIFHAGEKYERSDWLVKEGKAVAALAVQTQKAQDFADKYAAAQVELDAIRNEKLKEATRHADSVISANPAYGTCRLDDDGLRVWNSLSAPESPVGPGEPGDVRRSPDPVITRHGVDAEESPGNGVRLE